MKKFLLLLVGVLFALSAHATDYYLIGSFTNSWSLKCEGCLFTETSTSGVYELQYSGTIDANASFKVNDGTWDNVINLGASNTLTSDKTITIGTAETYTNHKDSKNFIIPSKLTNPYFLLDTNNSNLTVYASKPSDPEPGETVEVNGTYVYFQNTSNWAKVAVWAWNGGTNCNANGTWPGDEITSANSDGGYYFWACKSETTPAQLLFNQKDNPDSGKTGNFDFVNGALYKGDGTYTAPSTQVIYFDANGTGWSSVKMSYRTAVSEEIVGTAVEGKDGVYKFVFATALPTSAWTVKFTDGTNTLTTKSDFENYTNGYVYKANGTNIEQAATSIDNYPPVVVTPTAYTIYFDAAGTAWNGATLTYYDGQATVAGAAVEGKAGVYSFSFESTLTEAQMLVKVANSDKSFSAESFVNGHIYKLHRGALKDAGEYTAEYTVTTPVESTIYFTTEGTGWTGVKIHIWDNFNNDLTGAWGNTAMTKVEGTDNVWKFTIPVEYMKVLCGIKFTDGYKGDKHETNTLYADDFQAGHLYKIDAVWTVASQGLYEEPTPTVETAYTIYFDTLQSGWRKVALFNDGVEVVGSLVKTGYIHGANEDGVEGYLHKYTVNTTDPTKLTFTNGTNSYPLETITDGNVYYVSEGALADAALGTYKVNANPSYRLHGTILGNSSWDTYMMTYFDGLWILEADNFVAGNFGIKKLGENEAVDKTASSTNPWIYAKTTDDNAHHVVIGDATNCAQQGTPYATVNPGNFYSAVTGTATLVFDPANDTAGVPVNDPNMTIMFINPAVAATATATVDPVSTTSHANKLSVTINVSDYSSVVGGYALSNGTFTAVSTDGNFTNVPYASNYTLTVGSTSMPINITMPAEPTFDITAVNATVYAPAEGQTNGILSVAFTVSTTWAYNLPHVICTCNGVVIPGEVEWSTNGFTFNAAEAVPLIGTAVADDMTFKFVITPEYPFMVNTASPRGQMRVSGIGYQTVLGTAIIDAQAQLTGGNQVSGIEGVVIEAEDAPVEYFNLQGQRVNGELAPGIYIRRQGSTVTKVRI